MSYGHVRCSYVTVIAVLCVVWPAHRPVRRTVLGPFAGPCVARCSHGIEIAREMRVPPFPVPYKEERVSVPAKQR
jgi:hypothetical protein